MRLAAGACAVLLCTLAAPAEDAKKAGEKFTDQMFVIQAGSGGMHEVALGKLAATNAENPEVKKFGERMVTDHTKGNMELMEAAKSANVGVPAKMLDEHQKHVDHLGKLKGAEFDAAYMKHMVEDHKEDIALFQTASKQATNPAIKQFATKTLPTLQEHLKMAEKINGSLKGGK